MFDAYKKKSTLKAAIKQTTRARENEGSKADQLFISAYEGFASVVEGNLVTGEALYNWGFALLHQAKSKDEESSIKLYLDAISKFTFCLLVAPNHLGAAIDGGVAYMDLARIMKVDVDDELYELAGEFFDDAERIQRGSAAYNFACIYAIRGQQDICSEALELAREYGSLPNIDDILNDADMANVKNDQWFKKLMERVAEGPEPEVVDKNEVKYDVEGNVVTNKKKKQYENEVDGVIYDAEGNVLREKVGEVTQESTVTEIKKEQPKVVKKEKPISAVEDMPKESTGKSEEKAG